MSGSLDRRRFLRLAGLAAVAAACSSDTTPNVRASSPPPTPAPASTPPPSTPAARAATWRRIEAKGPQARRDASLTGDPARGRAYLFGGRSGSGSSSLLGDLWVYDVAANSWRRSEANPKPKSRFGHSAGMVGGSLVVFGGQSGPNAFLNDVWMFDPDSDSWRQAAGDPRPAARYGSGEAIVDGRLLISHGFTNSGRFDDTWTWSGSWRNDTPPAGVRPVKRCLHRTVWWPERNVVALFGGQTNGEPFLNDFWLYDPAAKRWTEAKPGMLPAPRTLFAMFAMGGRVWVWGGFAQGGQIGDMWWMDDPSKPWQVQPFPDGQAPGPRGGVAADRVSGGEALMFGGRTGEVDLDELWMFSAPPGA